MHRSFRILATLMLAVIIVAGYPSVLAQVTASSLEAPLASGSVVPADTQPALVDEAILDQLSIESLKIAQELETELDSAMELSFSDRILVVRLTVTNSGTETTENMRLEVPLLAVDSSYQEQIAVTYNVEPTRVEELLGARVATFPLGNIPPQQSRTLEIRYDLRFYHNAPQTGKVANDILSAYLLPSEGVESDSEQIHTLANEVTASATTDWDKAEAITAWVASYLKYDSAATTRNKGALTALTTGSGVCEDYAALAAAMARAVGIPARIVYGYADPSTKWDTKSEFALRGYRHAWVEFHLEGHGFVVADPTLSNMLGQLPHDRYIAQNYNDISLRARFRGSRPSVTWVESIEFVKPD